MKKLLLPYRENLHFSKCDIAYIERDPKLNGFYNYETEEEAFGQIIKDKGSNYSNEIRRLLVEILGDQYQSLPDDEIARNQIQALSEDRTYSVCTAHQPCLATGPLYVIYKIISTINLSRRLNKKYPNNHFVPVFVSGGEDHDLEEINHFYLFGKKVVWNTKSQGPVGRMPLDGLEEVIQTIRDFAGKANYAEESVELVEAALKGAKNYGHFSRRLIASIFAESGLVILSMDGVRLKAAFKKVMEDDLFEHSSSKIVTETQEKIEEIGFDRQAYARDINLFYFHNDQRLRIERSNSGFEIIDSDLSFSADEMRMELEEHPEKFSPNVILRPVFQEMILPNLAYVGGGGEIAYWLERRKQFEHFEVNFPMLVRRNSVFWMDHIGSKNLNQIGLEPETVFEDVEQLINRYVLEEAEDEISLEDERGMINKVFDAIEQKALTLDQSINKTIRAEETKHIKSIDHLENKLLKAKKHQLNITVNKIRKTHEKLFPHGKPQERVDNFLMYYFRLGPDFLIELFNTLDPLERKVVVIQEEA